MNFNRLLYIYGDYSEIPEVLVDYAEYVNSGDCEIVLDVYHYSTLSQLDLGYYNVVCSEVELDVDGLEVNYLGDNLDDVLDGVRYLIYGNSFERYSPSTMYEYTDLDYNEFELGYEEYIMGVGHLSNVYSYGSFQVFIAGLLSDLRTTGSYDDYDKVEDLYNKLENDGLVDSVISREYDAYVKSAL